MAFLTPREIKDKITQLITRKTEPLSILPSYLSSIYNDIVDSYRHSSVKIHASDLDPGLLASIAVNPQGTPTESINTIEINGTIYMIMGTGGDVVANPEEDATEILHKLKVDDTVYASPASAVSPESFKAEQDARKAGDEIQPETISDGIRFASFLADQENAAEVAIIRFTADIESRYGGVTHRYKDGDVVWFPPKQTDGKVFFNDKHGHDYTLATANDTDQFDAAVRSHNTAANRNKYLYILCGATFTAFTGGAQYSVFAGDIWVVNPNATAPRRFIPLQDLMKSAGFSNDDFTVKPVNGLDGIAATADLDGDYYLTVGNVGQGIDISQATRYVVNIIGSDGIINQGTQIHEVDPWTPDRSIKEIINVSNAEEANVQAALASTPGRVRFALSVLNVNARVVLRTSDMPINSKFVGPSTSGDAKLTQAQQIGLLSIRPDPELIDYPEGGLESALTRTISLRIPNPQLLTGDIWYEGEIDGVPIVARTKWTERTLEIQYVISSTTAQTIGQNPQLRLNINFYDAASAGTFVTSRRYDIPLIKHPKQYGGGFGIMTAGQYAPVGGISLAGYSSSLTPAAGSPGSITGYAIETIGGLYTVLLNTTVSGTYVGLEATKTYFVKPSNGSGRTPLAVIINGGVFAVGAAIRNRWYEVIGFNSIAVKQTYNIQVIFTDGRSLIEHHIPDRTLYGPIQGLDNAGVQTVTLPANYTDWKWLYIGMWENDGNRMRIYSIPTALLAAQSTSLRVREGGVNADWNKAARTVTSVSTGVSIIHSVLYN